MMSRLWKYFVLKRQLSVVLAGLWTLLIFIGCTLPGSDLPPVHVFEHFDKLVHFTFFGVFQLLWVAAVGPRWIWICVLLAIGYGFYLEFYQAHYVKGRSFDVWDGIADSLGALLATFWIRHLECKKNVN